MNNSFLKKYELPESSGVYIFKDKNKNIIYIGKAKNIKNRVKQYFRGSINSYKTTKMLGEISSIEWIITNNEKDALILEKNLIEKNKPNFNILLIDNKKYPYIRISLKKTLEIDIKFYYKEEKKTLYFGPFPSGFKYKAMLDYLNYNVFYKNGLPIKKNEVSYKEWEQKFNWCKKIMSSNNKYVAFLKEKMLESAKNEQYEIANNYKQIIEFLSLNKQTQLIELKTDEDIDIIGLTKEDNFLYVNIELFRFGIFSDEINFTLEINICEYETIRQFLNQFYSHHKKPNKIITNIKKSEIELFFDCKIINPLRGNFKIILDNVLENSKKNKDFNKVLFLEKEKRRKYSLDFLSKNSNLKKINSFLMIDNSHFNNENVVSVFVSYRNGFKVPNEYRKYYLDVNLIKNKKADVKYIELGLKKYFQNNNYIPDLLIVDGSISQFNIANETIKDFNLDLRVVSLVKNKNHKTQHLIDWKGERKEISDNNVLNFLSEIQEEVDRYAKTSYRNKKINTSLEGSLLKIKGINEKTEEKILKHFKNYSSIYNASIEELEKVVSKNIAIRIKTYFEENE